MKHVEIGELVSAIPLDPPKMTRAEKLHHWAELVRKADHRIGLMHAVEYMSRADLAHVQIGHVMHTALGIAALDPKFQAEGLSTTTSLGDALRFFEVTQHQAHAFSCDCGGAISNAEQADRIARLA